MAATLTINEAQTLLREKGGHLRCIYEGRNRTIFYNPQIDAFGVLKPRGHRYGYRINWDSVQKIYAPREPLSPEEHNARLVNKYKAKAAKATFTNPWIRRIAEADPGKSLYDNNITTGNGRFDGQVISLSSVAKAYPTAVHFFREALAERRTYRTGRFDFRGYEATLELWHPGDNPDDISGSLSLEYKNCGNGYYYLLINDEEFIAYEID